MNSVSSYLLRTFLNHKYHRFGTMTHLAVDTATKTISLKLDLAGETVPLDAEVQYSIEEADGRLFFIPAQVRCSRKWLNLLADELVKTQRVRVEIPAGIASVAVKMLGL